MSTPPSPTSRSHLEDHDTGFPEPFGHGYNTTLPHPSADTSPNATMSFDALSINESMKRRRYSIISKHRRKQSQNSTSTLESVNGVAPHVARIVPGAAAREPSPSPDSLREMRVSVESLRHDDPAPVSSKTDEAPAQEVHRHKSFVSRFHRKSKAPKE